MWEVSVASPPQHVAPTHSRVSGSLGEIVLCYPRLSATKYASECHHAENASAHVHLVATMDLCFYTRKDTASLWNPSPQIARDVTLWSIKT